MRNPKTKIHKCDSDDDEGSEGLGGGWVEKIREEFIGSKGPNLLHTKAANVLG